MLTRVANNLFWMGRYLERTEHIARFINVNYFSLLDAPNETAELRQLMLKSITYMVNDIVHDRDEVLKESEVLYDVGLNPQNSFSILSCFKLARENASGSRDLLSIELFEAVNKLHHYIENFSAEYFVNKGLDEFTMHVTQAIVSLRGKIAESLIHNEAFAIISLGINLERASQVIRIINTKYIDAKAIDENSDVAEVFFDFDNSYEWSTLLKSIQSFDMMKRYCKKVPTSVDTLSFSILNPQCPKSIMSCLNNASKHIDILTVKEKSDSTSFLINKIRNEYKYTSVDEIEVDFSAFISETINKITSICIKIEEEYFS